MYVSIHVCWIRTHTYTHSRTCSVSTHVYSHTCMYTHIHQCALTYMQCVYTLYECTLSACMCVDVCKGSRSSHTCILSCLTHMRCTSTHTPHTHAVYIYSHASHTCGVHLLTCLTHMQCTSTHMPHTHAVYIYSHACRV